jgi:hypothetical protein
MRPYWSAVRPLWVTNLRASHFLVSALAGIALITASVFGIGDFRIVSGTAVFLVSLLLSLVPSFVRANAELYANLADQIDHLRESLAARPKLVFDFRDGWPYRYLPGDQRCSYRVQIRNSGSVSAHACRVVIVDADDAGLIDAALHWSQVRDYERETLIDLPANAARLVDVAATFGEPPVLSWEIVGARHGNHAAVRNGYRQRVTFRAEAENAVQHAEQAFEVYMDGDRAVDLRMRTVSGM